MGAASLKKKIAGDRALYSAPAITTDGSKVYVEYMAFTQAFDTTTANFWSEHGGLLSAPFFFFSSRRRHTRFSRDWSSDVCSSDLGGEEGGTGLRERRCSGGEV